MTAITIRTADGNCRATLFGEVKEPNRAGIILYMNIWGPRPALDEMGERLSKLGYLVLVPDIFYRFGAYGPLDATTGFKDPVVGEQVKKMLEATTQAMTVADSAAFIETLTEAGATGPIGAVGYCMGGARAMNAAAAFPDRVKAAASLHGGGLATDAEDSPHKQADKLKAKLYVGVAGVDSSFPPDQSAKLAQALREAEVDHIIENYVGCAHGWTMPDSAVYDEAGAERHWVRLKTFFGETLQG